MLLIRPKIWLYFIGFTFALLGPFTALANDPLRVEVTAVTDGDSLRAGDLRLRLFGIDAPEIKQICQSADGRDYQCGIMARDGMRALAPIGAQIDCTHLDTDRYKRLIVSCYNADGDIAEQLIADGLAIAYRYYSKKYVPAEMKARTKGLGLWAGTFQDPYEFRKSNR